MTDKISMWRLADVPEQTAIDAIYQKFPKEEGWEIVPNSDGSLLSTSTRKHAGVDKKVFEITLQQKTAAPFPPQDDEADAVDKEPIDEAPEEPKEEPKEKSEGGGKDSQILDLLKQIADAMGVSGGGDDSESPGPDVPPQGPPPEGMLPPPVKPHHDMGRGLSPNNLPAFAKTDLQRIASSRMSLLEIEYVGGKLKDYVAFVNAQVNPYKRRVAQVQTGTVKGVKLVRIAIGPKE